MISIVSNLAIKPAAPCRCRSHAQHVLFQWLWHHRGGTLKAAAAELHLGYATVRMSSTRLNRRKDLHLRCPECFAPTLRSLICTRCGVEFDLPTVPIEHYFDLQDVSESSVHTIQPGGGLGSATAYEGGKDAQGHWRPLKMTYGGSNVRNLVERPDDPLLERAKSQLWQELKEVMPEDGIEEEATRLLVHDVNEYRTKYPRLVRGKNLSQQLVDNVLDLMRLRYPALRKCNTATAGDGHP